MEMVFRDVINSSHFLHIGGGHSACLDCFDAGILAFASHEAEVATAKASLLSSIAGFGLAIDQELSHGSQFPQPRLYAG